MRGALKIAYLKEITNAKNLEVTKMVLTNFLSVSASFIYQLIFGKRSHYSRRKTFLIMLQKQQNKLCKFLLIPFN